ncbi:hypothetical protein FIBSPDRAFT_960410 [Athelia psychrophila]|uniref:Brf1 TBP-binding domain-containing protein n=1 Tax=Athelia psychrophila TaxID=1759441 RepID=A0A166CFM5_9AGAM|nr:hypothetical protein FIBSPDRAFT_960410 [Fibularhizoctonia sp. CBS 109695]
MNNFRRSVEEVVQVVKIADSTVRKRLDEFKGTRSGGLTVADFRSVWLEDEMDPPAFVKGKEKEERERVAAEEAEAEAAKAREKRERERRRRRRRKQRQRSGSGAKRRRKKRRRRRRLRKSLRTLCFQVHGRPSILLFFKTGSSPALSNLLNPQKTRRFSYLNAATDSIDSNANNTNIDPSLLPGGDGSEPHAESPIASTSTLAATSRDPIDEAADDMLAEEVSTFLQNQQGAMLSSALDEAEARRRAALTVDDELLGLDEDELDRFLLNEAEVKIKERVWVELNKEYHYLYSARGARAIIIIMDLKGSPSTSKFSK